MEKLKSHKTFGGMVEIWQHQSLETKTNMTFSVFIPPDYAQQNKKKKTLIWLSGLTCTHENFFHKAGAFQVASELGILLIAPDTSPRDPNIPGRNESFDFGIGAGFYLDATLPPYDLNYRMFSYVSSELRSVLIENFAVDPELISLAGHSMGGHGALILGLKEPEKYRSISAFAPICAPSHCELAKKAFTKYLRHDEGINWDSSELASLANPEKVPEILIDIGTEDEFFLSGQLKPERLKNACETAKLKLKLRMQGGYDHSYYFVSTFIAEHLHFHARHL